MIQIQREAIFIIFFKVCGKGINLSTCHPEDDRFPTEPHMSSMGGRHETDAGGFLKRSSWGLRQVLAQHFTQPANTPHYYFGLLEEGTGDSWEQQWGGKKHGCKRGK